MKTTDANGQPPRWAEALLRMLLVPEQRESVSGDLLEAYRDTYRPLYGPSADWWYIRQVGSFVWRASRVWSVLIGGALIVRYLFDTMVPVSDYKIRASVLTYTIIAVSFLAGCTTAWRTRSLSGGAITSFGAATLGALFSTLGAALMLAVWHDPATLAEWRNSGGLDEAFIGVPVKIVVLGAAIGIAGAMLGKVAASGLLRRVTMRS